MADDIPVIYQKGSLITSNIIGVNGGGEIKNIKANPDGTLDLGFLTNYKLSDVDDDASPNYYGYIRADGAWYIMKETISAGADTYRYVSGTSGYNWANRASETYVTFDSAF